MKTLTIVLGLAMGATAFSQTYFYGGDFDGRNGWTAQNAPFDGRIYDDFQVTSQVTINGLFGNYLDGGAVYSSAEWEIRTGVTTGSGGTLVASGTGAPTSTLATGRSGFGLAELQISISGLNVVLNPGLYYMSLAIENTGGGSIYVSSTSGADLGPGGDPNPAPTGSPIANGNSFFNSSFYGANWADMTTWAGGGTWDWSYGINVVPEPSTFAVLGLALGCLLAARRRK